ncbi:methylmalonyl-CoA epimerase [Thermosipho atlanticus]|uniref:Methylmalonyl-CoA epimerase n=1 Tax=Thermosipho atlanticus DSM 15807 TaxID=1123380 RepID=A0A1M5QL99_9BACT|nr:methylmalonyl-CoA epimerase [Thermosipho atlanticus]SHH14895.1 methylmalonyl-CoA epimerase [Thermosipho atlanticus DSM 15807]
MKAIKIDHIGIVVRDAKERLKLYRDFLGLKVEKIEELPERGLKVYFIQIGETRFELLEPLSESSEITKFLETRGEGIHHIAVNITNIEEAVKLAKENGFKPLSEEPKKGAGGTKVLFLHPKTTGGVLLELVEGEHK